MPELLFNPEIPVISCPPQDATPADNVIYRQSDQAAPNVDTFRSHAELGKRCDVEDCRSWGCSVWPSLEAAVHARKLFPHFRQTFVLIGHVGPEDGVVKHTPNNRQPEHFTFWKAFNQEIFDKFMVVLEPEGGAL